MGGATSQQLHRELTSTIRQHSEIQIVEEIK